MSQDDSVVQRLLEEDEEVQLSDIHPFRKRAVVAVECSLDHEAEELKLTEYEIKDIFEDPNDLLSKAKEHLTAFLSASQLSVHKEIRGLKSYTIAIEYEEDQETDLYENYLHL